MSNPAMTSLDHLSQCLLNDYQHRFPMVSTPFAKLALELKTDVDTVLKRFRHLKASGAISRIGPVFKPNTVGASTLAALAVPTDELEHHAAIINRFEQVNHNYEREHKFNLWFVLTAANQRELNTTLDSISKQTGHQPLVLPLEKEYHIDLGFRMRHLNRSDRFGNTELLKQIESEYPPTTVDFQPDGESTANLIAAIQDGLPLVEHPYRELSERLDISETEVIDWLKQLIHSGTIKRFGVVVRHLEAGYQANAMVVWDVPDHDVDRLGDRIGQEKYITLCYRRPRVSQRWPYNLFCMIHGRDRSVVLGHIGKMRARFDIGHLRYEMLFSGKRYKQRGARYRRNSGISNG